MYHGIEIFDSGGKRLSRIDLTSFSVFPSWFSAKDVVSFQAVAVLTSQAVVELFSENCQEIRVVGRITRRHDEHNWTVDYKLEGTACQAVVPTVYLRNEPKCSGWHLHFQ
eukprot:g75851.t1